MEKRRQNRWYLLGGCAVLALLVFLAGQFTNFSSDPLTVLPQNVPEIEARKVYQKYFLPENDVIIAINAPPPADAILASESLAEYLRQQLPEFGENAIRDRYPWEDPNALSQLGGLAAFAWSNTDSKEIIALADRLGDSQLVQQSVDEALETLATSFMMGPEEAWLAIDPLKLADVPGLPPLNRSIAAEQLGYGEDGVRAILIDLPGNRNRAKELAPMVAKIEAAVAEWEADDPAAAGVEIMVSGFAPYMIELTQSMRRELLFSAVATLAIVLCLFLIVYRTAYPLAVLAVTLGFTALTTILLGGVIFGELNAISIGFAAILIALVVDYSIIVYQEKVQPSDPDDTFGGAVMGPVIWAAATTALVFAALNFSALPGIRQLGSLVAIGLIIGAGVSLSFFSFLIGRKKLATPRAVGKLAADPKLSLQIGAAAIIVCSLILAIARPPGLNTGPDTLLPKKSKSMRQFDALVEELQSREGMAFAVLFR
ncbi:MAG: MMPL family transporter, partial [Verrucomicrobiota bacterium]